MNNKLTPEQQTLCDDLDKVIDILDGSPAPADARPAAELRPDDLCYLRVEHARMQGSADGFQIGWHAALARIKDGDSIADLARLVPEPRLASLTVRAEQAEARLASETEYYNRLQAENGRLKDRRARLLGGLEQLEPRLRRYAVHEQLYRDKAVGRQVGEWADAVRALIAAAKQEPT